MMLKFLDSAVVVDPSLGARQIRVIANSGQSDRVGDVLVAAGCKLDTYKTNPIVLADHDRKSPIGTFSPEIKNAALQGVITFAPKGISAKADEYCGLYKSGIMRSVSVGFNAIEFMPLAAGGYKYTKWELVELSCVTVPMDPGAGVIARAHSYKTDEPPGLSDTGHLDLVVAHLEAANDAIDRAKNSHARHREQLERFGGLIGEGKRHVDALIHAGRGGAASDDPLVDAELAAASARRKRQIDKIYADAAALDIDPVTTRKAILDRLDNRRHKSRVVDNRQNSNYSGVLATLRVGLDEQSQAINLWGRT